MKLARYISILPAGSIIAIAAGLAAPCYGQVIQIEDDGAVVVQGGPAVTTDAGAAPIVLMTHGATQPIAAGRMIRVARPIGALGDVFAGAAREAGLNPRLLHAVAWHESRFRQDAVSVKGAIGIMQLMPDTARGLGVDPRDMVQNIRGGALLLARLLRQYRGDVSLTLAAYNAGPGAVARYRGVPPYAETRDYVAKILQFLTF